jgi:hypothetical protein
MKTHGGSDMLPEYDFTGGVRGKYASRYTLGANVVVLDPDVAAYFPDRASVNRSLRTLVSIIRRQAGSRVPPAALSRTRPRKRGPHAPARRTGRRAAGRTPRTSP